MTVLAMAFYDPCMTLISRKLPNTETSDLIRKLIANGIIPIPSMENGPWIAGGSVRRAFTGEGIGPSDIDIFFKTEDQFKDATQLLDSICHSCLRTRKASTYSLTRSKDIIIQIIRNHWYQSVEELLSDFDITVCQIATDGIVMKMTEEYHRDITSKCLKLTNTDVAKNNASFRRISKYSFYGYNSSFPDFRDLVKESIEFRRTHASKFGVASLSSEDELFYDDSNSNGWEDLKGINKSKAQELMNAIKGK